MKAKSTPQAGSTDTRARSFSEYCWEPPFTDYADLDWPSELNIIGQYRDTLDLQRSEAERSHDSALCEIAKLSLRAYQGNAEAAEMLARVALYATATLNRIAKEKPETFTDFATLQHAWPVIKTRREALSANEKTLFSQIKLGGAALLELDAATAKWKMDDAGKMAYRLLNHMHEHRRLLKRPHEPGDKFRLSAWSAAVRRLPDFSDESAPDWWKLARAFILEKCPATQNVPELNALVTLPSERKSGGRIRHAILRDLKRRFLSLARNTA
jgi:hypothetical protein